MMFEALHFDAYSQGMVINIEGESRRIGLALSGGGFRAAAFHLGTFRKLEELGLLGKVDLLSCVSGGSIAGAFLAANWGQEDVLDRLESYLRTRSIAISSFLAGMFNPFTTRLEELAERYDQHLFAERLLGSLGAGPRIYLNATNLSTGNMFFFVAGGGGPSEMGEHEMGTVDAPNFKISHAVAASSAFPPVFPPLRLDADVYPTAGMDYVTLSDGGIYDNLGANPLFRARNQLAYAIVSDGGKPFANTDQPTESATIVLKESVNILMEQVRGLQFQRLVLSHAAGSGPKPVWFSIDSQEGEAQLGDAAFASAIGTNLKRLGDAEMGVLVRHAGALLHDRLARYAPELLGP